MNHEKILTVLPQFLILLPAAASCYFAAKNQMRYTPAKTALLCIGVLLPYSLLSALACSALQTSPNTVLLPGLVLFFFLYRRTVSADLPRCLAIYVGVCAIETFPAQFAYALDAYLHPLSGAAELSAEAALFRFGLSCLLMAAFLHPACRWFSWAVDSLDAPKIWYSTAILSSVFLIFNLLAVPKSYRTLHAGRMNYLFPLFEGCSLALLVTIYVLFYYAAKLILDHARLKEHNWLLELQSRQYRLLQEHMQQTARLRHDFRHSVRLLFSLAEEGNLEGILLHLAEYEKELSGSTPKNFCSNAALNALFGYYHEMAATAGISTDWHITLPESFSASELDIASLFGNLMENAITACLEVPEGKRYFSLTSQLCQTNRLYIVSTNSFSGNVHKEGDGYRSTKHSGRGTGLASIAAVAEKYGGTSRAANSDTEFFVDVTLKI